MQATMRKTMNPYFSEPGVAFEIGVKHNVFGSRLQRRIQVQKKYGFMVFRIVVFGQTDPGEEEGRVHSPINSGWVGQTNRFRG